MRRLPAFLLTVVAITAVACSSAGTPAWTYAPASSVPAPSGAGSGAPSAGASAAPSAAPSVAPSVAPSASPAESAGASGETGLIVKAPEGAATGGFDPTTLDTAAGAAFTLTFDNEDTQAPHNLVLQNPDGTAVTVEGDTAPFQGPGDRVYQVPALTAGDYKYMCQVHPTTMFGTLTVK